MRDALPPHILTDRLDQTYRATPMPTSASCIRSRAGSRAGDLRWNAAGSAVLPVLCAGSWVRWSDLQGVVMVRSAGHCLVNNALACLLPWFCSLFCHALCWAVVSWMYGTPVCSCLTPALLLPGVVLPGTFGVMLLCTPGMLLAFLDELYGTQNNRGLMVRGGSLEAVRVVIRVMGGVKAASSRPG